MKKCYTSEEKNICREPAGFFSATDADSKNDRDVYEEGFYFTWTPLELDNALGKDASNLVKQVYGVTQTGNLFLYRSGKETLTKEPIDEYGI